MIYAILAYALAMTCANLTVAAFGPWVSPINAFFLIGLDLTLRDHLHVRLKPWQMLGLIAASGLLTLLLNPAAGKIATASAVAFTAAALVDWGAFSVLRNRPWMQRVNGSNAAGALVDSLVFPTLAFGAFMPHIVALQFAAKVAGGAVWALLIARMLPSAEAAKVPAQHGATAGSEQDQPVNPEWPRERIEAAAYSLGMRYGTQGDARDAALQAARDYIVTRGRFDSADNTSRTWEVLAKIDAAIASTQAQGSKHD